MLQNFKYLRELKGVYEKTKRHVKLMKLNKIKKKRI